MADIIKADLLLPTGLSQAQVDEIEPHFLPPEPQNDNYLVTLSLRRIEGMILVEQENPGTIPQSAIEKEYKKLLSFVGKELAPETKALPGTEDPQQLPTVTDAQDATKMVFKRAIATAKAIIADPQHPEHEKEKALAMAEARGAGYRPSGSSGGMVSI